MDWKLIHLPSVQILTHLLICPHTALESHLNLVPGFRACYYLFDKRGLVPAPVESERFTYSGGARVVSLTNCTTGQLELMSENK